MLQILPSDKRSSHYFWEAGTPQHPPFRRRIRWTQQNNTAETCRTGGESCFFRKYYPIEIRRPQWPDWVDSDAHNILRKVSRGPTQCRSVSANCECDPEHHRSAGRGQTLLPTYTDHLRPPVYSPLPPSCLQLWPGYTLPSADGKQITRHIKGPLSVHGLTHNMHKYTQAHTR